MSLVSGKAHTPWLGTRRSGEGSAWESAHVVDGTQAIKPEAFRLILSSGAAISHTYTRFESEHKMKKTHLKEVMSPIQVVMLPI